MLGVYMQFSFPKMASETRIILLCLNRLPFLRSHIPLSNFMTCTLGLKYISVN